MFTKYKSSKDRNKAKSARREAKKRSIQSRIEKEKLKPQPPIFQIGEELPWKGCRFRIVEINGPEDVRLKMVGYTENYLFRGGDREFYVKRDKDPEGSKGTDSKKLVGDTSGAGNKEASDKLEGVSDKDSEAGGSDRVVRPDGS